MKKKISLVILFLIMFITLMTNAKAENYTVITDANNIKNSISNVKQIGENYWYNSFHGIPFQYIVDNGSNKATLCTEFRKKRPAGTTATCTLSNWSEDIRVGVAGIIKAANIPNTGMTQQYYYADIAINYYLFENQLVDGKKNYYNQVTSYPVTQNELNAVLGTLGMQYYNAAEDAVEKYETGLTVNKPIKVSGQNQWTINAENRDNIVNSYKVTGNNVDSFDISVKLTGASSGVKVYLKKGSNGTYAETKNLNGLTNNDEFFVKIANFDEGEDFTVTINVKGNMNYYVASNYECTINNSTEEYQSLTINELLKKTKTKNNTASFKIRTYDAPNYPQLKIIKKNTSNQNVKGSEITLYEKNNDTYEEIDTFDDTNASEYTYDELSAGTYCVEETKAPSGYNIDHTKHCFTVTKNNTTNEISVTNPNNDNTISITNDLVTITLTDTPNITKIWKVNEQGNYLPNAHLKLVRADGGEFTINGQTYSGSTGFTWYSTNEQLIINQLRTGLYRVYEIEAPSGFMKTDDYRQFRITNNMTNEIRIAFPNRPIVLNVKKIDIISQKELKGAKMQILYKDQQGNKQILKIHDVDQEWISEETPHVINEIPAGTYYLKEEIAPDGYILKTEEIEFTIDEYGKVSINEEQQEESLVVMSNTKNSVYISKRDITSSEEISGAYLQITDTKGNIVKTIDGKELKWQSTNQPYLIQGLKAGVQYVLTETIAPNGYVLSKESVVFSIDEQGNVKINNKNIQDSIVILTNAMTEVSISKQDITTKEELPGATLRLLDEKGNIVSLNGEELEWVSTNEPRIIKGLPAGTYTLTEITAPDGYTKSEETITFTIDANGVVSGNTIMYNTPIPEVPNTLSTQSIIITIAGLIIVSSGIGLYIYGLRKKKNQI